MSVKPILPHPVLSFVYFCLALLLMLPLMFLLGACSQPPSTKDATNTKATNTKTDTSVPVPINQTQTQALTTPIRIAAAANLANVLPKIITAYQVNNNAPTTSRITLPTIINVTYASSGKLYAQIKAGAPYDIFLSANQDYPLKLANTSLQPFTYARGQLAWYSTLHPLKPDPINTANPIKNLSVLPNSQKITIANPLLAPYGASAQGYLQQLGVYDKLQHHRQLIQAENIGQAFQYVHSGSVDYGLVAVSQLVTTAAKPSQYQILAPDSYPPILQNGIVLHDMLLNDNASNTSTLTTSTLTISKSDVTAIHKRQAANDFATYLQSPAAQQQFVQAGYLDLALTR